MSQVRFKHTQDLPMTPNMVTIWYRAPEILMGHKTYSLPSDVWSLGVTCVEIERGRAPFQASTDVPMLRDIFQAVGGHVPGTCVDILSTCTELMRPPARRWGHLYGASFQKLVDAMLVVEEKDRITAHAASRHGFCVVACSGLKQACVRRMGFAHSSW